MYVSHTHPCKWQMTEEIWRHLRLILTAGGRKVLKRELRQASKSGKEHFSALQWNVLAAGLSLSGQGGFRVEDKSVLEPWSGRRAHILAEIVTYSPDIVALQEVDDFPYFDAHLSSLGYVGHFQAKPNSPCLTQAVNIGPDGCALFHRGFKLLDSGFKVELWLNY